MAEPDYVKFYLYFAERQCLTASTDWLRDEGCWVEEHELHLKRYKSLRVHITEDPVLTPLKCGYY